MPQGNGCAGLSGLMRLPVYPRPQDGEVLSSYVARLANANGLRPYQLTVALGLKTFWNFDPDVTTPISAIKMLEDATGHSLEQTCSLKSFLGPENTPYQDLPHLMLDVPRTRVIRGMPVCPLCIQEGQGIHWSWRLATTIVCTQHGCWLVDACSTCLKLNRHVDRQGKVGPTSKCWLCGDPLPVRTIPDGSADSVISMQNMVQEAFAKGMVLWGNIRINRDDLISLIYSLIQLYIPENVPYTDAARRFESSALKTRRKIVTQVAPLLEHGLASCLWALRQQGIHPMQVCRKAGAVPTWLREVVEVALAKRCTGQRGQAEFRFLDAEWATLAKSVSLTVRIARVREVETQLFIERWLTGNLRGQGWPSQREQQAGLRALDSAGALTLIIEALLANPRAERVLTAHRTVGHLLDIQNPYGEQLWRRMVERQIEASRLY